jgi:multidrug efflux pump subunit AcrA (membrane-fusion protein)
MSKKILYLTAAMLSIGVVGYVGAQAPESFSAAAPPRGGADGGEGRYVVTARKVGARATLGGTVIPFKEVTLAAQLPGRVVYLRGGEGTRFKKGQVLVALDEDELLAQRRGALADLDNAEIGLRNARVQFSRQFYSGIGSTGTGVGMGIPNLFDQMFTRPMGYAMGYGNPYLERHAEVVGAGSAIDEALAHRDRAISRIQQLDSKLRDTRSIAPLSGVVTEKYVEVGDPVQPGQPLIKLADVRNLQVRVEVPSRQIEGLKEGMKVRARLDVSKDPVTVRVAQIYPMADAQRHTVTVKFDLPRGSKARPGMYAEVTISDISVPSSSLPWVPKSAVQWRGSLPAVFVLTDDNRKELRMIRVGEADENGYTVLSGLQVGERVVAKPGPGMVSGTGWRPKAEAEK